MDDLIFTINDGTQDIQLVHSPDGWDDSLLEIERSPKFLGIVRTYSVQLKFMLDGATLLRDIFYNKIQAEATLRIDKLDRMSMQYVTIFTGIFDFMTFIDDTDKHSVSVTVLDNGLSNAIKKNMDKDFNIGFLTDYSFEYDGEIGTYTTEYIHFSRLVSLVMDKVTDGGITSAKFAVDVTAIEGHEILIDTGTPCAVMTNEFALAGGRLFTMPISLKNTLQAIWVIFNLVPAVEIINGVQTLKFYQTVKTFPNEPGDYIFTIEKPTNIKLSVASEFLYDTVSIGFPTQDYGEQETVADGLKIKHEHIATYKYSNDSAFNVLKDLDLICPFQADNTKLYRIKEYYNNNDQFEHTPFVVCVKKSGSDIIIDLGSVETTTTPTTSLGLVANTTINPALLLLSHENFIDSCFWGASDYIKVNSLPFNIKNLRVISYTDIYPGQDLNRLNSGMFKPIIIELDGIMPDDFNYDTVGSPTKSRCRFSYEGTSYDGYIINMKLKMVGKIKATVKLLSHPFNDLTKLIR